MNFAVILSGCGQHDGSETHEVITTLLSIEQENHQWFAYAPDRTQSRVIDHLTNKESVSESREILLESARLTRGKIKPLSEIKLENIDAIIFPGGFGAVTNWCNWLSAGTDFVIEPDIAKLVMNSKERNLPMGFICIAPVMIAKLFTNPILTIGNDKLIAEKLESLGATHIECSATEVVVDEKNMLVSTPANMLASNLLELHSGIRKLVQHAALLSKKNRSK